MAMKDELGDRMKKYEKLRTAETLNNNSIVYVRIDGRSFSKFTKGLQKPFDSGLRSTMIDVTKALVHKTHALIGYTQSDEISLAYKNSDLMQFGGKIQKLSSILGAMATSHFIIDGIKYIPPEHIFNRYPHFDARIFELPDNHELTNAFLWRYNDAHRNAVMMIAQSIFSHKKLNRRNVKEVIEMLAEIGVFPDTYPAESMFGTFIKRETFVIENEEEYYTRDKLINNSFNFKGIDHKQRYEFITGELFE